MKSKQEYNAEYYRAHADTINQQAKDARSKRLKVPGAREAEREHHREYERMQRQQCLEERQREERQQRPPPKAGKEGQWCCAGRQFCRCLGQPIIFETPGVGDGIGVVHCEQCCEPAHKGCLVLVDDDADHKICNKCYNTNSTTKQMSGAAPSCVSSSVTMMDDHKSGKPKDRTGIFMPPALKYNENDDDDDDDGLDWDAQFALLEVFHRLYRHCFVPSTHRNQAFYRWIVEQHEEQTRRRLNEDRVRRLENLGFFSWTRLQLQHHEQKTTA